MLERKLWISLKVLVLWGYVVALFPDNLEDESGLAVISPTTLQEECASKCPDLDLNQV